MLEEAPIWEAPHRFTADVGQARRPVFSYGLLLPEIRSLGEPHGRAYLASRWGDVEVDELAIRLHGFERSTRADILSPLVVRHREDLEGVTTLHPLDRGLARFVARLQDAADERALVPEGFEDDMRRFLDAVKRPDTFGWMYRRGKGGRQRVRVPSYRTLYQRLGIEFDHLVSLQPRLSRCALCRRCFVPRRPSRPEAHCCANLWLLTTPPRQLERCVPFDETERLRTRQRLYGRLHRARARHGQNEKHPEVVKAKRELSEWLKANPPRVRGRQPEPSPDLIPDLDRKEN